MVVHHTQCGSAALTSDEFADEYAQLVGDADRSRVQELAVVDPEVSARTDAARVRADARLRVAAVTAAVYDIGDGSLRAVAA